MEEVRGSRVVVLNLWRNISPSPIERLPLALCDRRTVRPAELRPQPLPRYDGRSTGTKSHEILRSAPPPEATLHAQVRVLTPGLCGL